jgi:predicted sulfurtransferase
MEPSKQAPSIQETILNLSTYFFKEWTHDLESLKKPMLEKAFQFEIRGTILLAPEGINIMLAGEESSMREYFEFLKDQTKIRDFHVKESFSDYQPYNRMLVRIKKQLIPVKSPERIKPLKDKSSHLDPVEFKNWIDQKKDMLVLDTRNTYEVELGTFKNATHLNLQHFRDFEDKLSELPDEVRNKPVVTFCTGGIRCEKAAPLMKALGFKEVYQLDGGILKYFEKVGGEHWDGECFVFDRRTALDPKLNETDHVECYACRAVVTSKQQKDPRYERGVSCPACFKGS